MRTDIAGKGLAIYVPDEAQNARITSILSVTAPYISLNVNSKSNFPYGIGYGGHIKVFDPEGKKDFDQETRSWFFAFQVASVEIIDSSIWLTGLASDHGVFTSMAYRECEENHLPYEHQDSCRYLAEHSYQGPFQLQLYDAWSEEGEESGWKFEMNKDFWKEAGPAFR